MRNLNPRALQVYISGKILVQRRASPGHGCAICCSMRMSSLGALRGRGDAGAVERSSENTGKG